MPENSSHGMDVAGGVEDQLATEELLAVYQAFPYIAKANMLYEKVEDYHTEIMKLSDKIEESTLSPVARLKWRTLNFLIDRTFHEANELRDYGNSFLPPSRPFA